MGKKKKKPPEVLRKPIKWHIGEDIVTRYANQMVFQRGEHECVFSFFESLSPIELAAPPAQRKAFVNQLDSIDAKCVARVAVPLGMLRRIADLINTAANTVPDKTT